MGFLDSLKTWLRSESADAKDLLGDTRSRLETDLDRREAELAASPAERLEQLQDQIADGDDTFDELRDKIEGRSAKALSVEEVAAEDVAVEVEADAVTDAVDADVVDEDAGDAEHDSHPDEQAGGEAPRA